MIRRLLQNLGLVLLGTALAALAIETASRLVWRPPQVEAPVPRAPKGQRELKTARELTSPNTRGHLRGVRWETNRHGCRDRNYTNKPGPNVFRIVVGGDSFTAGQGVLGEDAYPNVLERLLNQDSAGTTFEVINLGVPAMQIYDIAHRVKKVGLRLDPHLIVYGLTINDIEGPHYNRTLAKYAFAHDHRRYELFKDSPSRALRLAWPRIQSLREMLDPPPGSYLHEILNNYDPSTKAWRMFDSGFDRFAKIRDEHGVPVVVFIHTWLFYLNMFHPFQGVYSQIEEAAAKRDLPVIQSFPVFRGETPSSLWVSRHDFHPNVRGQELLAQSLLRGLTEVEVLERR